MKKGTINTFEVKMKVVYTKIPFSEMTDEEFQEWELETLIITENITQKEIEDWIKK